MAAALKQEMENMPPTYKPRAKHPLIEQAKKNPELFMRPKGSTDSLGSNHCEMRV